MCPRNPIPQPYGLLECAAHYRSNCGVTLIRPMDWDDKFVMTSREELKNNQAQRPEVPTCFKNTILLSSTIKKEKPTRKEPTQKIN